MTESCQSPRNGLAKLLWEAEPDDSPEEIASQKEQFQCPACGWLAELRRNECMVCDYDQPLHRPGANRGDGE